MKKIYLMCALLFAVANVSQAQYLSLPAGASPDLESGAASSIEAGVSVGGDSKIYAGRFSILAAQSLMASIGLGFVDVDDADMDGPSISVSAAYEFLTDLDFYKGVRTTVGYGTLEGRSEGVNVDVDILEVSVLGVIGSETDVEGLQLYGNAGISFRDGSASGAGGRSVGPDSDFEPQIGGGIVYALTPLDSIWAAVDYVDDAFVSLGLRHDF